MIDSTCILIYIAHITHTNTHIYVYNYNLILVVFEEDITEPIENQLSFKEY